MTSIKAKAIESAERVLGPNASAIEFGAFVRGYMAGHAAHTRWASKHLVRKPVFQISAQVNPERCRDPKCPSAKGPAHHHDPSPVQGKKSDGAA